MSSRTKVILYLMAAVCLYMVYVWADVQCAVSTARVVPYAQFQEDLKALRVYRITQAGDEIQYWRAGTNHALYCDGVLTPPEMGALRAKTIAIPDPDDPAEPYTRIVIRNQRNRIHPRFGPALAERLTSLSFTLAAPIILIVVFLAFIRKSQAPFREIQRDRTKLTPHAQNTASFANLAGCDEAKADLTEIAQFLLNPQKFVALGALIPKGVLIVGPTGTGKTELGRALAAEAKVPLVHMCGAEFVEMYVGVGAKRMRDLFQVAKNSAPCVLFIDDLDVIAKKPEQVSPGLPGTASERDQTLHQLLTELDNMAREKNIAVVATATTASNLEAALLRPGRFERHVVLGLPDMKGREAILRIQASRVTAAGDIDYPQLAHTTDGFSPADLGMMVNEAAITAALQGQKEIRTADFMTAQAKLARRRPLATQ